jgi:hypothetical protein
MYRAGTALALVVASSIFVSPADARYRRHYGGYSERASEQDAQAANEVTRRRAAEFDGAGRRGQSSGGLSGVVERLIRGCVQQGIELQSWPFDSIARITSPDDTQRTVLAELRSTTQKTADGLLADCPQDIPAAPLARFDAVEQAIDAALAGFARLQPALQAFYRALDDEQKARLLRDVIAGAAQDKAGWRSLRRSDRWRAYASAERAANVNRWAAICENLTAALRGWPIREIERNVRLSETQRVAFFEFVTTSLKAADTLAGACPADIALTPVGRLETMQQRLAAVRAATVAIRPTLSRFYEALDQGQKVRFAGMS